MRALLVAGSLAAFALLGTGLAQAADPIIPGWSGSSIGNNDYSFGSSGLRSESGPTGSALGSDSLGSTNMPADFGSSGSVGSSGSASPVRSSDLVDRIASVFISLPG